MNQFADRLIRCQNMEVLQGRAEATQDSVDAQVLQDVILDDFHRSRAWKIRVEARVEARLLWERLRGAFMVPW